jgi:hypothetical protein
LSQHLTTIITIIRLILIYFIKNYKNHIYIFLSYLVSLQRSNSAEVPTLGLSLASFASAGPAAPSSNHPAFDPGDSRVFGLKKTRVLWEIPFGYLI